MDVRIRTDQRFLVSASMVVAWVAVTGLLMSWQGGLGGASVTASPLTRTQARGLLDGSSSLLWLEHASLLILAMIAAFHRRSDIMGLLLLGPEIAFAGAFVGERWFDSSWSEGMFNYHSIGWLMSLIVAAEYWCLFPDTNPAS